jgi:hypothetical protein
VRRASHVIRVIPVSRANSVIRASRVGTNDGSSRGPISLTKNARRNPPRQKNRAALSAG